MNSPCRAPLAAACFLLAAGCSQGLLAELDRVLRDPLVTPPSVSSLDQEFRIAVAWDPDPGAEQYVLERAVDSPIVAFVEVYRGTGSSYTDTDCQDQCRYLFRLGKIRGERLFGPSASVLGVASATCKDELEPNDCERQATALEYDRRANLYYYRATPRLCPGGELEDADWYTVEVPPHRVANLLITQFGLEAGSQYTLLHFYQKGTTPVRVVNNQLIAVSNPSPETRQVVFKLYLDPADFLSEPTLGGGTLVDYTLSLYSLVSLQAGG